MPHREPELRYGRIVWAVLKDHNGFRKNRPGIVLTPTHEISSNQPLVIVCVTTTFPDHPPVKHVPLPWNPNPRRVVTQLARRSAAVVDWLDVLYPDEILELKGDVPDRVMEEIQRLIRAAASGESPQ